MYKNYNNFKSQQRNKLFKLPLFILFMAPLLALSSHANAAQPLLGNVLDPQKNDKSLICHVPDGNPENAQTQTLKTTSITDGTSGHETHPDDSDGPCVPTSPTVTVAPAVECQAQLGSNLRFNFYNPVQIAGGTDISAVGTKFLFSNVTTGIDAFVEVVNNKNAKILEIDIPSEEETVGGTGPKWSFQPFIQPLLKTAGEYYIEFKISFVDAGTNTPSADVLNSSFIATSVDIDSTDDGLREFVEYGDFYQYYLENPTEMVVSTSDLALGAKQFLIGIQRELPGISVVNTTEYPYVTEHRVTGKYDGTDTFTYRAGVKLDNDFPDVKGGRQFSLYFNCVDYETPNVVYDNGDAPATYGEASHAISDTVTTPLLYLGAVAPDPEVDFLSKKIIKLSPAPGSEDDLLDNDDEDGVSSMPALHTNDTSYTIPLANISLVNNLASATYLYGFIDFNRDGDFADANEIVKVNIPAGAVAPPSDLTWTGLSGLTAGDTFARFRLSTDPALTAAGIAGDGEVEDYPLTIEDVVCTAFSGEVNEVALPLSSQLKTTDKLFVPSKSIAPINGHLRAYAVDDYGVAASTASWDAATRMSIGNRASNLYSTDASGNKIAFNSLDDVAFLSSTLPVATIKEYTINPSAAAGIYLAGRESGSFLGGISKGNELDILSNKISTSLYLTDTAYRDYYTGTVATRSQRVLMSSDDGFLYAFDYTTGDLIWAWMPRTIASDLVDFTDFQSKHLMAGSVDVLDLDNGSGSYATYVVGSYKRGLGHYVLKLNAAGNLDSVVWDDDQSGSFSKSPNNGEMEFFKDGSGKTYAAYVLANDTAPSRLKIKSLADSSEDMSVDLNYQASSTPFVMPDYGKSNAPANKTLYLGSSTGDIHAGKVLAPDGSLKAASDIQAYLQASNVSSMADSASDPVLYIDSSVSAKDSLYYLSSQTATRLTLHRYEATNASWNKAWTSYSSGAGDWDDSDTYSADNSGVPSDKGGFDIVPPTGIQSLPVDATLTARAVIVGDAVVLPLSVLPASSSVCYGKAYYYLYSLSDGKFPSETFYNNDGSEIVTDIALGYGGARQLSITDMAGSNKLLGYGIADKKADLGSGIATSFVIKDPVAVGIRGWKEIGR